MMQGQWRMAHQKWEVPRLRNTKLSREYSLHIPGDQQIEDSVHQQHHDNV